MPPDRVKRTRAGAFLLRLTRTEREGLASALRLLERLLDEGDPAQDPAVRRLFPPAYMDDPTRSAEFDGMVHDELLEGRRAAIRTVERTLDAVRVDRPELEAWLSAVNDIRLVLGVRLGVSEDTTAGDFDADPEAAQTFAFYASLSWLEEDIVRSLAQG